MINLLIYRYKHLIILLNNIKIIFINNKGKFYLLLKLLLFNFYIYFLIPIIINYLLYIAHK